MLGELCAGFVLQGQESGQGVGERLPPKRKRLLWPEVPGEGGHRCHGAGARNRSGSLWWGRAAGWVGSAAALELLGVCGPSELGCPAVGRRGDTSFAAARPCSGACCRRDWLQVKSKIGVI